MFSYSKAAAERAIKVQEVCAKCGPERSPRWHAVEILGISA
jgi:hypothetical protein